MRVLELSALTIVFSALPWICGRRLLSWVGPWASILVALISLIGVATGSIVALLAIVDPFEIAAHAIPGILKRCIGAATELFASHPWNPWFRIFASSLLVLVVTRLAYALMQTAWTARTEFRSLDAVASTVGSAPGILKIESSEPLAYTVGLMRRRVVISTALLDALDRREARAILAHESAHVRGWHTGIAFAGRVLNRALGFLPPVRAAVDQLILGLEVSADDAAAREVGDPLTVARALAMMAERATPATPTSGLGAAESEIVYRVRRLTSSKPHVSRSSTASGMVVVALAATIFVQLFVLGANGSMLGASAQLRADHHICHLPHTDEHNSPVRLIISDVM